MTDILKLKRLRALGLHREGADEWNAIVSALPDVDKDELSPGVLIRGDDWERLYNESFEDEDGHLRDTLREFHRLQPYLNYRSVWVHPLDWEKV
jgi:hypothetical protein